MQTLEPERLLNALEQSATAEIMKTLKMRVQRYDRMEALVLIKNVVETADKKGLSDEQCEILYERLKRLYVGSAVTLRELPKNRWLDYARSSLAGSQTTFVVRAGSELFHARPFLRSNRHGDDAIFCVHGDKRLHWLELDQVWRVLPGQDDLSGSKFKPEVEQTVPSQAPESPEGACAPAKPSEPAGAPESPPAAVADLVKLAEPVPEAGIESSNGGHEPADKGSVKTTPKKVSRKKAAWNPPTPAVDTRAAPAVIIRTTATPADDAQAGTAPAIASTGEKAAEQEAPVSEEDAFRLRIAKLMETPPRPRETPMGQARRSKEQTPLPQQSWFPTH